MRTLVFAIALLLALPAAAQAHGEKHFVVHESLLNDVLEELQKRPFEDVNALIQRLVQGCRQEGGECELMKAKNRQDGDE